MLLFTSCQFHSSDDLILENNYTKEKKGKILVAAYACASCHEIKDVSDNPGMIGPPLRDWKRRKYIAGKLNNNKKNLVQWIMHPQQLRPETAMPDLGVLEKEAEEISAYLYSQ